MTPTTFAKLNINRIECTLGRYAARLTDYGDEKRAVRVVRAWGGPLFRGARFAVYREGTPASTHSYAEIAAMFDLPIGKTALREPKPVVVRKPVRVTRPPRAKKAPAPAKDTNCRPCDGQGCARCEPAPAPTPARAPAPSAP